MESGWKFGPDSREKDEDCDSSIDSKLVDQRRKIIPSNDSKTNLVVFTATSTQPQV